MEWLNQSSRDSTTKFSLTEALTGFKISGFRKRIVDCLSSILLSWHRSCYTTWDRDKVKTNSIHLRKAFLMDCTSFLICLYDSKTAQICDFVASKYARHSRFLRLYGFHTVKTPCDNTTFQKKRTACDLVTDSMHGSTVPYSFSYSVTVSELP